MIGVMGCPIGLGGLVLAFARSLVPGHGPATAAITTVVATAEAPRDAAAACFRAAKRGARRLATGLGGGNFCENGGHGDQGPKCINVGRGATCVHGGVAFPPAKDGGVGTGRMSHAVVRMAHSGPFGLASEAPRRRPRPWCWRARIVSRQA